MIVINQLIGIGRFLTGLLFNDGSEIRVSGNHKINDAISIGRDTGRRNVVIITRIYGDIDGNFLADFYFGDKNDRYYHETFSRKQRLTLSELRKFDVFAYGDKAEEIAGALSEYVH